MERAPRIDREFKSLSDPRTRASFEVKDAHIESDLIPFQARDTECPLAACLLQRESSAKSPLPDNVDLIIKDIIFHMPLEVKRNNSCVARLSQFWPNLFTQT